MQQGGRGRRRGMPLEAALVYIAPIMELFWAC